MRAEADAKTQLSVFDRHRAELTGFAGGTLPGLQDGAVPAQRRAA